MFSRSEEMPSRGGRKQPSANIATRGVTARTPAGCGCSLSSPCLLAVSVALPSKRLAPYCAVYGLDRNALWATLVGAQPAAERDHQPANDQAPPATAQCLWDRPGPRPPRLKGIGAFR